MAERQPMKPVSELLREAGWEDAGSIVHVIPCPTFDDGKDDWTLFPPAALQELLELPGAVAKVRESLALWRSTRERRHLLHAAAFALVSEARLDGVVSVLEFGAGKYQRESWRTVPDGLDRYYNAAMRHLDLRCAWFLTDVETGFPTMDHVLCNIVFLLELTRE